MELSKKLQMEIAYHWRAMKYFRKIGDKSNFSYFVRKYNERVIDQLKKQGLKK